MSSSFHLAYGLSPFLLITFSIQILLDLFFATLLCKKVSVKIIDEICPQHSVFNIFKIKNFLGPTWSVTFCKNNFKFWCSCVVSNIIFRIFISILFAKLNKCLWFYNTRLHFSSSMICIVVFFSQFMSANSSIYTFFDIEVTYL